MCSTNNSTPSIMVFKPTWKEFQNFNSYIEEMEKQGAHKAGIAKVIPPTEWIPRKNSYNEDDVMNIIIPAPIRQNVTGMHGIYEQRNVEEKPMTVSNYKKLAESKEFKTPTHSDYENLERQFWKNISYNSPLYGADVTGSITDNDVDVWNINKLGTILDYVDKDYGIKIEGVNTAYLYFGMWKTLFPWHTEDMDLYSINYIHYGFPKTWYAIPPEHGHRLEKVVNDMYPAYSSVCPSILRHKITIISPNKLKQFSIPYNKITQKQGEIIITFPFGYHAGFNHGFNIAESTNFASPRWVEYGKRALSCHCRPDSVKFSMDTFIKRYQPEKYELWLKGNDVGSHPEDPSRTLDAPMPSKSNILLCNTNNTGSRKSYNKADRKRQPVKHKLLDSPLSHDTNHVNKAKYVHSPTSVQGLDKQFNDEQREVKEDICVKANKTKKRTLKKQETKKNPTLKKNKNSKSTDGNLIALDQTNNHTVSTTDNCKGIDYSVHTIISEIVNSSWTFEIEQFYNIFRSMNDPYCSLCMMVNCEKFTFNNDWKITALIFMHLKSPNSLNPTKALFKHATSGIGKVIKADLVRCNKCYLIVHKVCYGINVDTSSHWCCDRCMTTSMHVACVYCPIKYGALREFKKNEWSHVECYLLVHGNSPLTINTFSTEFAIDQKCTICKLSSGNCFRCSDGNCNTWSHISCGILAGFMYRIDQINKHISIDCKNHCYVSDKQQVVHINQKVWVKHLNDRIVKCRIVNIDETPSCIVKFSENAISDSIPLNEIMAYANLPSINQEIHLKSGEKCLFLGFNYDKKTYSVEYDDGSFGRLSSCDLISWDEDPITYLSQQGIRGLDRFKKDMGSSIA